MEKIKTLEEALTAQLDNHGIEWMPMTPYNHHSGYIDDTGKKLFDAIYSAMDEYASQFRSEWISVKDRLPESGSRVMVVCEYGVTMADYTFFNSGNQGWWAVMDIGTCEDTGIAYKVTHWMPLPTKPKN